MTASTAPDAPTATPGDAAVPTAIPTAHADERMDAEDESVTTPGEEVVAEDESMTTPEEEMVADVDCSDGTGA